MTLVTMISHHHHPHNNCHNKGQQQQQHSQNQSQLEQAAGCLLHARLSCDGGGCQVKLHEHQEAVELKMKQMQMQSSPDHLSALVAVAAAAGRRQHKNSTASSTTDQCSSLNMSSLASSCSASSSVQHSPLLATGGGGGPSAGQGQGQDASQTGSNLGLSCPSLIPPEFQLNCDSTSENNNNHQQEDDDDATKLLFTTSTQQQRQKPDRLSSVVLAHNTSNLLHPTSNGNQAASKVRSFSHSNAFCPQVTVPANGARLNSAASSPGASSGRHSAASSLSSSSNQENNNSELTICEQRPRRLSRIEHRLSLAELGYGKIESYFKLQRLGKGTYATVYMGRSRLSNDLVALKEILKEHDEGAPCTAIREVSLLRLLRHNNIVTLHDICHTPRKLTLVFEYVGPDLYAYMKENNNLLSIHNVRILLYQLLRGISFCHSRQVLHRDLKPQNLLINSRGELKICDFGLARAKSIPTKSYSNEVVTLWYRPPDVLLGNTDYDHSIDMWGVGCIFYEMASGRTFFPGSSVRQQLYLIFSSLGAPNRHNWPEILQNPDYQAYSFPSFRPEKLAHRVPRLDSAGILLLMSFLRFKPSERISADEARRDPFFASLPEQVHYLSERESIFDVPGVYMTPNPGQKMNNHHHHHI